MSFYGVHIDVAEKIYHVPDVSKFHSSKRVIVFLNTTAQNALRAVLYVAERRVDVPVRVDDIAAKARIPRNYLSENDAHPRARWCAAMVRGQTRRLPADRGP